MHGAQTHGQLLRGGGLLIQNKFEFKEIKNFTAYIVGGGVTGGGVGAGVVVWQPLLHWFMQGLQGIQIMQGMHGTHGTHGALVVL